MLEDYGCVGITTLTVACALHDTTWTTMTSVSVTSRDDGPSRSIGPKRRGDSATHLHVMKPTKRRTVTATSPQSPTLRGPRARRVGCRRRKLPT